MVHDLWIRLIDQREPTVPGARLKPGRVAAVKLCTVILGPSEEDVWICRMKCNRLELRDAQRPVEVCPARDTLGSIVRTPDSPIVSGEENIRVARIDDDCVSVSMQTSADADADVAPARSAVTATPESSSRAYRV